MKLNILKLSHLARPRTHEGARAAKITPEQALRRSVLSCMLWENEFYEDGEQIAGRIGLLVPYVAAEKVAALAVEARERMKLRHAPLLLVREMARHATHRALVGETLARVIQRADELAEFLAIYWADGRQPLSAQVKKGLAAAFSKFDEYALAKYDRAGAVRLRDVLFLSHARPLDEAQAALWKRLADNELATPDTWEVALSAAGRGDSSKRAIWERLLAERKLGALALLRNLRNLNEAGVAEELVLSALATMKTDRVSAVPLPGCGTQCSAVGGRAGAGHVPRARRARNAAGRTHRPAGRRLRVNGGATCRSARRCGVPMPPMAWPSCCARSRRRYRFTPSRITRNWCPHGAAWRFATRSIRASRTAATYLGRALASVEATGGAVTTGWS